MKRAKYPTSKQLDERRQWLAGCNQCWVCGAPAWVEALDCHEIASRAQAPGKWACVENYFATCRQCHEDVLSWLPEAVQLAFKLVNDPDNYNRVLVNRLRSRADNAISEGEVTLWKKFVGIKKL